MQTDRFNDLKRKLSSLMHALLPMLAPFFLQAASASYLMKCLPVPAAIGSALGLIISYLLGPIGFFVSVASWGTYLALQHPELLRDTLSLLFLSSCVVSWWLSTLCAEQYQQKVVDFEEMIATLFKKNTEVEKQAKETTSSLRDEKKEHERRIQELDTQVQELQHELSSHRHHLSLAWQESSMLKEDAERSKKQLQLSLDNVQSQSMFYLQQKQMAEGALEQIKTEMHALKEEKEQKQNQFLEEFTSLQARLEVAGAKLDQLQKEKSDKEEQLKELSEKCEQLEKEKQLQLTQQPVAENSSESEEKAQYWETLYKQLRAQFDEKSLVLNETRKEFFAMESQLLILQRSQEDMLHEENEDQVHLIHHMQELGEECEDLEEQLAFLQDIVSSLQEKKKISRPKKKKEETIVSIEKLLESSQQPSQENLFSL